MHVPCPVFVSVLLSCNETGGACACRAGWTMDSNCHRPCPGDTFGDGCALACQCKFGICDSVTGECRCHPGYHGKK